MITIQINKTGERKNTFKNREQNREKKPQKELLATFGEIWYIQIKNSFILSGRVASHLKPTAKNIAPPPPSLKNLQQGPNDSCREHQSETMYLYIYIFFFLFFQRIGLWPILS